ncbi:MAG: hypothetical protein ABIC95_05700 [archaeon]
MQKIYEARAPSPDGKRMIKALERLLHTPPANLEIDREKLEMILVGFSNSQFIDLATIGRSIDDPAGYILFIDQTTLDVSTSTYGGLFKGTGTIVNPKDLCELQDYQAFNGEGNHIHVGMMDSFVHDMGIGTALIEYLQQRPDTCLIEGFAFGKKAHTFLLNRGFLDTGFYDVVKDPFMTWSPNR